MILSAPLLLFPSSGSPPPTTQSLKDATIAFASRLVQVPHQEAVLKSLMKIRDAVGEVEFESYLADYDDKLKKNIDVLSKIYNIKPGKKKQDTSSTRDIAGTEDNTKERSFDKSWDSDSDTSGIAEEEDEALNAGAIPSTRIVLETEIKFNEETAITMTILEEKDEDDSENDRQNSEANNAVKSGSVPEQRRTPRRVRFGGEIVKLRTPDSDETESIETTSKTRIPLPVSPATKMPETTRRRPSSQPCSPHTVKRGSRRASRSASSSPKRETYTHNAQLSPKKSILTRTGDAVIAINPAPEEAKCARGSAKGKRSSKAIITLEGENPRAKINSSREIDGASKKEEITLAQGTPSSERPTKNSENNRAKNENDVSRSAQDANADAVLKNAASPQEPVIHEESEANAVNPVNRSDVSEDTSKREKNFVKPSPRRRTIKENRDSLGSDGGHANDQKPPESDFSCGPKTNVRTNDSPFGSPVNDANACDTPIDDPMTGSDFVNDNDHQLVHTLDAITNAHVVIGENKYEDDVFTVRNSDGEGQERHSQHDGRSVSEGNGSVTCSSSEGEGKPQEPNWEELGLVGQEVLDDLHNKVREL